MKLAILIRHGESEANVKNLISEDTEKFPLTLKGRDQVKFTADQIRALKFDGIISSPVLRARQTAEIISEHIGIPYVIDSRIRESGLGDYNNRDISDVGNMTRSEMGMESWDSHIRRFMEAFNSYEGNYTMISHALPIRAAISGFLNFNEEESFGINIRNASMSVIDVEKRKVLSIGSFLVTPKIQMAFR
ncbi:2,3-diphosphoglycerate-dependent phosphoglycerate mutase [Oxyplasma meridianum]|uniref:2,3-diphosphoglycerate-dependent phosphoglycerate mutase n=1 Tax=Oxyplasma meridianum TaxID=3073602 RepID=A0AAX4NGZ2_9ARCH